MIRKLNEFSEDMKEWFTLEESESLIRQAVSYGQELLAAELVCRGLRVSFECCMSLLPFGSILYSLQHGSYDLPIPSEDTFEFTEVIQEEFCEIHCPVKTEDTSTETDPLCHWTDFTSQAAYNAIPSEPVSMPVPVEESRCLLRFYEEKLRERLEESKEQQSEYERWDERSRCWMRCPGEFLIALQQHNMSEYIPDLFSPSGTLLDRDYSLVRCSTRLDQAIQQLNEQYDLEQQIDFIALNEDDDKDVEEELNLLLQN